jgi:hypothetical protein
MKQALVILVAGAACVLTACDGILSVEQPARVPASLLDEPASAARLVDSAIADFNCAYGRFVAFTGLFTDELRSTGNNQGLNQPDTRNPGTTGPWAEGDCASLGDISGAGLYIPLSTARFTADDAIRRLESFSDDQVPRRRALIAKASAYAGYTYTLFGEAFCEGAFDLGQPVSSPEMFRLAEQRFTSALEHAGTNDTLLNLARVGRARVRLSLGDKPGALADARAVAPMSYTKDAEYSASNIRRYNYVYQQNRVLGNASSVDPRFHNLQVDGKPDPRVRVEDSGRNGPDRSRVWYQTKYLSDASPIRIASWKEAQLIIAEVEGGQSAVGRINALRAPHGLAAFSSTDPVAIAAQVREERRRELFLDGHRLGDMRRLGLPFDTVNHKNPPLQVGKATCFPLPNIELQR